MTAAVIFDLFDTLVHLRRNTDPYLRLCSATGDASRIRESLVADAPTLSAFCDHLRVMPPPDLADMQRDLDLDIDAVAVFPDTVSTLQRLHDRGVRVAVISNLASPYKRAFFNLGLDSLVDATVFSCDAGIAKPNPKIYHAALAALDLPAASTLMVGDSQCSDVDGPRACGIRGFLLNRSGRSPGDSSLESLSDVASVLRS